MARLKKEDEFYTMLKDLMSTIVASTELYAGIIDGFPASQSKIPQMKVYESECDDKARAIFEKLHVSFITPFDREDISELTFMLDDIIDYTTSIAIRFDLFNVQSMREEAMQMAELTLTAVHELEIMIDHLPNYKSDPVVMEKARAVGLIEDEGDGVYENALRCLFRDEVDDTERLSWLRLFDRMESSIDACEYAARMVRSVVMKSA
ncbi:DUF47 family protein [Coriobacteriales bacterium OH1046]|nr:DUF47 family protein [Coriobacteriales bacterium OH1046]